MEDFICDECGECYVDEEGDICLECQCEWDDRQLDNFIPDTPSLCNCEDRPCCGCPVPY
jgi:hypothetical protein